MYENTKATFLRWSQNRLYHQVFKGEGLHINPGDDPLKAKNFPLVKSIKTKNLENFNLEKDGLEDYREFDFVLFTHLVGFEQEPEKVLTHILKCVKSKGHLIFTVPDEDLYEQGQFPSIFNKGHKRSFSIHKEESWSGKQCNIIDVIDKIDEASCRKIELVDTNYNYSLIGTGVDQTIQFVDGVEANIEVILRKY